MSTPPILLTGSHRSGTTWVGAGLSLSGELANLHEPFNPSYHRSWLGFPAEHWFQVVTPTDHERYRAAFDRILAYRPPIRALVGRASSARDQGAVVREALRAIRWRVGGRRLLLKDPIAFFAADWLADTYRADVIVLVRHPAAFASSLVKVGWRFDFANFAEQPALMDGPLAPYATEIERAAAEPPDLLEHATLLWRCFAAESDRRRTRRPDWLVLRYEDLAADPLPGFAALYQRYGLRFDDAVAERLGALTSSSETGDVAYDDRMSVARDSRAAMSTWKSRLTPDEIARVRERTEPEAALFYADADW